MAVSLAATGSDQNSRWYRDAQSNSSPTPPHISKRANRDLLGLDKDELRLISKSWTCETLMSFIEDVEKATRRKIHGATYEKTRALLHTFSDFASQLNGITKSMPPNSEYSAALGAIAVLISSFHARADMEFKIRNQLNQLRDVLPTVDYLASAVKTHHMANAVAEICSEISLYLYEVIAYFKKPRLGQLVGSLVSNFDTKFGKHVSAIQSHTTAIRNLQSTANLAVSLDTINKLDQSTQIIYEMFKECKTAIAFMADKIEQNNMTISRQYQFTANLQTQNILEVLIPENPYHVGQIVSVIDSQQNRLTVPERWENRGFADEIRTWLQRKHRPLLYLSGEPKKNRMSFLSPFMVDLAGLLSLETDVGLGYVFCDTDSNALRLSPDFVVRQLIAQLLQAYPQLAVEYVNELPLSRFRSIGSSATTALELFRDVLARARALEGWPSRGFFILIDRVDLIQDSRECNVLRDLLPALQVIGTSFNDLNVVMTSSIAAKSVMALDTNEVMLFSVAVGQPKKAIPLRHS